MRLAACVLLLLCSCGDDSPPPAAAAPVASAPAANSAECIEVRSRYNQSVAIVAGGAGSPAFDLQLAEFMNRHWACFR